MDDLRDTVTDTNLTKVAEGLSKFRRQAYHIILKKEARQYILLSFNLKAVFSSSSAKSKNREHILGKHFFTFISMPEISDFQHTNSEFAKSEQKYPVKITLEYEH
jgi:hypothetical protein